MEGLLIGGIVWLGEGLHEVPERQITEGKRGDKEERDRMGMWGACVDEVKPDGCLEGRYVDCCPELR